MYRMSKRMAEPSLNLAFATKVSNLPVVNSAWIYASGAYGRIKNYNSILNYSLTTAEKSVALTAEQAKPIVLKFEKQIHAVDGLACKGLDKMQEKVPVISSTPEEIVQKSRDLYSSTIKSGLDKYNGLKNYGYGKVQTAKDFGTQKTTAFIDGPYGQAISSALNEALTATENCVNHYLPPLETEGTECEKSGKILAERIGCLSDKVQARIYHQLSKQRTELQTLVQQYKDNFNTANSTLQTAASKMWDRLNKDEMSADANVVERMLFTTRNMARLASTTVKNMTAPSLNYLPQTVQVNLEAVNKYSADLYKKLSEAKTSEEMSNVVLSELRTNAKVFQTAIYGLVDSWKLNPYRWLVMTNAVETPEQ